MKMFPILLLSAAILAACHSSTSGNNDWVLLYLIRSATGKTVFETANPYLPGTGFVGISGADSVCASDPARPSADIYLALLVDGTNRVASTGANSGAGQVNWVLSANTAYANTSKVTIFTTNASGLFVFGTMDASLGGTGTTPWTGLNADWTTSTNTCQNWAIASNAFSGAAGGDNRTNASFISNTSVLCNVAEPLLCVMQ